MRMRILSSFILILLVAGCAPSRYRQAEKAIKRNEYENAIRQYFKLLDPHVRNGKQYLYYDREAYTGIGFVYWKMQRFSTAIKILKTVVDKDPSFGKAKFYLGLSYEGLGNDDDAIEVYKKYPVLSSNDPYKQVLAGRLDWIVRRKITRDIQLAIQQESQLDIAVLPDKSIAVLYFLSLNEDTQWQPLQKGLAEMMISDLSQVEELQVVERLRLHYLMEELKMNAAGLLEKNTAPRLGKLLGTKTLVKGSYMIMPDMKMTLDANIYETENIFLPTAVNFEESLTRIFQIEKELVLRIIDYFGIELTRQQRDLILKIPTENLMAFMNYCNGLMALDEGNFELSQEFFQEAVRLDGDFQLAKDKVIASPVWNITHNSNLVRVQYDVAELILNMPKIGGELAYTPPDIVSTWNRLVWMGKFQDAGFLPGNETRESFQEADTRGAPVLPIELEGPPTPPIIH